MRTALLAVATVWVLGCVWSYQEQSAFAASKGFTFPHLLPLVIDGFAVSMAGVAWAASLDARAAVAARLATVIAVLASSASNGVWALLRTGHDLTAVVLAVAVPIAANLAFEVLLAEMRRQVQRRRGLPPPVAVPYPRLIRLVLAPWQTFGAWRSLVLDITATHAPALHAEATRLDIDRPALNEHRELNSNDFQDTDVLMEKITERITLARKTGEPLPGRRKLAAELAVTEHAVRTALAATNGHQPTGGGRR
jgi:hypothetical protein